MVVAHINGKMLTWAMQRAGIEADRLVKGSITASKLKEWEAGKTYPSEKQAGILADKLGISYAMLFMPVVPAPDNPAIPDLRTLNGETLRVVSLDFRQVLNDAFIRQDWLKEQRSAARSKKLLYIGKFTPQSNVAEVAADMRAVLRLTREDRLACSDFGDFIKHLVKRAEDAGVLVMRSAVVGHDTHRPLNVNEFRGFALSDTFAPLIFVNDADAKAAQVFTIAHELAHLWIGADGVSDRNPNQTTDSANSLELFCDKVAAELLVPVSEFPAVWESSLPPLDAAKRAARHFRVSTLVALRRAKDLGKLSFEEFVSSVDAEYDRYRSADSKKREKQKEKETQGGNFWASFEIRNGAVLNTAVVQAVAQGRASFTDASTLLGVTMAATIRYMRRVGAK